MEREGPYLSPSPKIIRMRDESIQKDISKMELWWTVEKADLAAKEWTMWRHLSSQAVSAVMHDAVQY